MVDANYARTPKELKHLVVTQNKVSRAILRKPLYNKQTKTYAQINPLYVELEVLKLQELYYYNLGSLAHDFFYNPNFPDSINENIKVL